MGLLQYDWDNETRLIHFCTHLVIKDRAPEIDDHQWDLVCQGAKRARKIDLKLLHHMAKSAQWHSASGLRIFQPSLNV